MVSSPEFALAFSAAAGVLLVVAANRLRVPSIALLLVAGVAVGPEGIGLIDPGVLGSGLRLIVGLAVAVILFEGGLTLDLAGARRNQLFIWRVLSFGVLTTWVGTALTLMWLFDLALPVAMLCGSLVIVTGPTVISPLLRRIGVRQRIKDVLYWEAVLVDAIGVFIAVLCFEWLFPGDDYSSWSPIVRFAARVGLGIGIGAVIGALIAVLLRVQFISEEYANIFVLAMALLSYGVCEAIIHESGVLAVIISGLVVGLARTQQMAQIKRFKLELTELGIGTLFILLAAKLELEPFLEYGWKLFAAVAILVLVLRPLIIAIATWRLDFSTQEKLFLSWIAPRGIVAAFMASLFGLEMASDPSTAAQGQFLQSFTFAVIGTTVILQGLTAPAVANILGLKAPPRKTWLITGPHAIVSAVAGQLRRAGARAIGLAPPEEGDEIVGNTESNEPGHESAAVVSPLIRSDPIDRDLLEDTRFADVGAVVAFSANPYLNQLICERWSEQVGPDRCYRAVDTGLEVETASIGFTGQSVWPGKIQPSKLLHGLDGGTLAVDTIDADMLELVSGVDGADDSDRGLETRISEQLGAGVWPLFAIGPKARVTVFNERESLLDGADRAERLVIVRPRIPTLGELIGDAVVLTDQEIDLQSVIQALLARAAEKTPDLPVDELVQSIVERERSMPTAMGAGVAIPHAYHEGTERSRCYVANVANGLASEVGPDGKSIRLVFLVLSPVGNAEEHLKSLATIAHLTSDSHYASLIEQTRSSDELLARIRARA